MKNTTERSCLFACCFLVIFLAAGCPAFAEAVYLKNGRIMVGRIIEQNQEYLVLKSGEGAQAVTATVFREDIAQIKDDEAYAREMSSVPFYIRGLPSPAETPGWTPTPLRPPTEDQPSRIFSLIQGDRALQDKAPRPRTEDPFGGLSEAGVNPLTLKAYAAYMQMVEERKIELKKLVEARTQGQASPEGNGRVSGVVTLPGPPQKMPVSAEASGGLYVYLLKKQNDGRFVFPVPMLYAAVDAVNLTLPQVRYEIIGVPEGRYKVFAQWDVASPSVIEEKNGEDTFLNYLGARGDYNGSYEQVFTIGPDEEIKEADFPCDSQVPFEEIFLGWFQPLEFEIKDIYYVRTPQEGPRILLVIKNTGPNPIETMTLDLYIDDMKMLFPLELNDIEGGKEKEFDISSFFATHLKLTEGAHPERKPRTVKFRVENPMAKGVEIEKTLCIY